MWLSRIVIQNFRNFHNLDVKLGKHAVIMGENKVGKTNLLFALRLILDPTLSDTVRRLRIDDFWDGLPRPLTVGDFIEISVEFRGFEDNENLLALLADHLVEPDPMVARITYRFQPLSGLEEAPRGESDYEYIIFGGNRTDNTVGYDIRRWMPMDLFPALRDVETDLSRWARSPLRPLLDRATQKVDIDTLKTIADDVHETTSKIAGLPEMALLVDEVNRQLISMVGGNHAIETALGFAPTDPNRLLRSLQLMIDGGKRGIADASLGSANVLYLALKQLEHQNLILEGERQHTFLAIEEPEAHLHPHLQRLIYRTYLNARDEPEKPSEPQSILLTTHSPNVASVAPLSDIVLLRRVPGGDQTIGKSLQHVEFQQEERIDLERYLDVTRGELFFSKGVILVEGDSEKFLLPTLARLYDPGLDFDVMGITVCSISGTNFRPYIKLLGSAGLDIPFIVFTDFDPKGYEISQEDSDPDDCGVTDSYGTNRVVNQIMLNIMSQDEWAPLSYSEILTKAPNFGVFLNTFTFEVDMFKSGTHLDLAEAAIELTDNGKIKERFKSLSEHPELLEPVQFMKDINSIGKGRLAQRIASKLQAKKSKACPPYIKSGFEYIKAKLA